MATANPQSPPQPIIPIPAFIFNHDIIALANLMGRFVIELTRSDSSNSAIITPSDATRWTTYLAAIDSLQAVIVAAPLLDLPKTSHSVQWPVEPLDPVPSMNNEQVEDLVRLFMVNHAELLNSNSGNDGSGLSVFDAARLTALTAKTRNYLAAFTAIPSGLDLPASSPMDPLTPVAK